MNRSNNRRNANQLTNLSIENLVAVISVTRKMNKQNAKHENVKRTELHIGSIVQELTVSCMWP